MSYNKIVLDNREARGRNGMFNAQLIEVFIQWQEPEHIPQVVVEIWSRRKAEGKAPIRFQVSMEEAVALQLGISDVIDAAWRELL